MRRAKKGVGKVGIGSVRHGLKAKTFLTLYIIINIYVCIHIHH